MHRFLALTAVLLVAAFAITTAAQTPPESKGKAASGVQDRSLAMIPTDSLLVGSIKVSKLWDDAAAAPLREWMNAQKDGAVTRPLGAPFADIDRISVFCPSTLALPWRQPLLVLVSTRAPYDQANLLETLHVERPKEAIPDKRLESRVFTIKKGDFSGLGIVDERRYILFANDRSYGLDVGDLIIKLLARNPDGPLAASLMAAQEHDVVLGVDVSLFISIIEHSKRPGLELRPNSALTKARTALLTADFAATASCKLTLTFADEAITKRAGPELEKTIKDLSAFIEHEVELKPENFGRLRDASKLEGLPALPFPWMMSVLKSASVSVEGTTVIARADVSYRKELSALVDRLPQALTVARHEILARERLERLVVGAIEYHDEHGRLPSDVIVRDGKPIPMSWRVQILPYLDQLQLYKQLQPNRPWDDPANLKVLEKAEMPKLFEIPDRPAPKNHTYFRVFTMPKEAKGNVTALLREGEPGPPITSITDGTSNTIMIVEAGEPVLWYKPDLLAHDGKLPLPQLGDKNADRFLAGFCDGKVRTLRPSKLGEKTLRAMITINGEEIVEWDR